MPGDWDYAYASRVRLDPSWPGLTAPETEIRADPDTLEQLGKQLQQEADSLEKEHPSYGSTADMYMADTRNSTTAGLENATETNGERWFGRWQTATDMESSLMWARHGILKQYGRLAGQLRAAGALLVATAEDYRREDNVVRTNLEHAAGWDQIARQDDAGTGPPAGQYVDSVEIPYVTQVTDVEDAEWIEQQIEMVRNESPWFKLSSAGRAFEATGERLADLTKRIKAQAGTLETEWASETSIECQKALQRIAGTAEHLGEASRQLSDYSFRSAEALQTAVSGFPNTDRSTPETIVDTVTPFMNPVEDGKKDAVKDAFRKLNEAYMEVSLTTLPGQIAANLPELPPVGKFESSSPPPPPSSPSPDTPPAPATPAPGTAPASAGPGGTGGVSGFVGTPAGLTDGNAGVPLPGDQTGPGSVPGIGEPGTGGPSGGLAGAAPGAPGGVGPGGLGGVTPGGAGPGAATPGAPGSGISGVGSGAVGPGIAPGAGRGGAAGAPTGRGATGGAPGGRPGAGVAPMGSGGSQNASGGRTGSAAGRPGGSSGAGVRPAGGTGTGAGGAAGRGGAGMAPMAGRGSGSGSEEHSDHDSWLTEDDDPWRGDDDGIPPPVIK